MLIRPDSDYLGFGGIALVDDEDMEEEVLRPISETLSWRMLLL
jgi:hypothetical protein